MKKFVLTMLIAIIISTSAGVANAYQINISGGKWNYGISNTYVWSNYYHGSKGHGSTAIGKYTSFSGYTKRGNWSYASAHAVSKWQIGKTNKTYYNLY